MPRDMCRTARYRSRPSTIRTRPTTPIFLRPNLFPEKHFTKSQNFVSPPSNNKGKRHKATAAEVEEYQKAFRPAEKPCTGRRTQKIDPTIGRANIRFAPKANIPRLVLGRQPAWKLCALRGVVPHNGPSDHGFSLRPPLPHQLPLGAGHIECSGCCRAP